ncbi:MAG: hypothetical protein CVU11_07790 [Bacteroidetes bacterium HGW-Bacteroidetes-6]|jgi:predicted Zn-dependent peptidase|nr:MAG: hypothetical protein CVU11_07790 [Bacteroidetes bacterium HGW-Bacteroidetes-6]
MKSDIDRLKSPALKPLQFDGFPEYITQQLGQDTTCYIFKNNSSGVVKLDLAIPTGSWHQKIALQASTTARMFSEGSKSMDAFAIAEAIDFNGAHLDFGSSHHYINMSVVAVFDKLLLLLPIIESMLSAPTFPENEMQTILANNKQDFAVSNRKVMGIARRVFPAFLYGENHPYGRILKETDFDRLTTNDLIDFYHTIQFSKSKVYLSGHIDNEMISALDKLIANPIFSSQKTETNGNFNIEQSVEKKHYIEVAEAVQSAIIFGLPVVGRNHEDFPLLMLANTILGGYFGSRLMKSIREDKGLTYGISSGIAVKPFASHLTIQTEVKAETTTIAVDEIFKEISRLSIQPVSNDELNTARNFLFGNFLRSMDGPFQLSDRLQTVHPEGLQPEIYYSNYWNKVAAATPSDIQQTVIKHLNPDNMHVLVVGKEK